MTQHISSLLSIDPHDPHTNHYNLLSGEARPHDVLVLFQYHFVIIVPVSVLEPVTINFSITVLVAISSGIIKFQLLFQFQFWSLNISNFSSNTSSILCTV